MPRGREHGTRLSYKKDENPLIMSGLSNNSL
jgi:hypothetical protein